MSGTPETRPRAPSTPGAALDLIADGAKLGLGTGRAAATFIAALGDNLILDCAVAKPVEDPHTLDRALRGIAGVVDTGLFLGTAERVLVGFHAGSRVEVLTRRGR